MKQKIEERALQIKESRKPYRTSWGFLIRPKYTDAFAKVRHIEKDTRPKITGKKAFQRFHWYKNGKPLGFKLERCHSLSSEQSSFWVVVYSGTYYLTISLDTNSLGHICTLYYHNQDRRNYEIAVATLPLKNFYMKNEILSKLNRLHWKRTTEMDQLQIPL